MREIIRGTFEANERGFGFVRPENEEEDDIFIAPDDIKGAMHGDIVEVRILSKGNEKRGPEGEIIEVIERVNKTLVGRFEKSKNFGFVVPDNKKIAQDIFIMKENTKRAKTGDKVIVQIKKWPKGRRNPEGKVIEIIGKEGDVGVDVDSIMYSYNLQQDFPALVEKELKEIPNIVSKKDIKNRRDLRDRRMVTIDSEDAKDLDDAVSVEKLDNGNILLGVHIADVSHYVRQGTELEKEALKRGTSVYLVDRVIPMLPKKLSNGICSLNAGVDRLAFSVDMEIDKTGKVVRSDIYKSVINVDERMTYTNVTKILVDKDKDLIKRYKYLMDDFKLMEKLYKILKKKRVDRGNIDFDLPEAKVILDEEGKPIEIKKYDITISNGIIEQFMLEANETVAERFNELQAPFIYRIHETPDSEKLEVFINFIYNYGYTDKNLLKLKPKAFQEVLYKIKDKPEEKVISTIMLRSMQQAKYKEENLGHFGLAAKYYCHFTSPIRRYPDLFIHTVMSEYIENNYNVPEKKLKKLRKKSIEAAKTSSERERNAQLAERDSVDLKKAEYMEMHVGEEFTGIVSSVTGFGFFVELPNTIEGLVRVESLHDDYYVYNEKLFALVGERTRKVYKLGDEVKVQLVKASKETSRIDFEVLE